ncbi:MAG TPA: hypothetical protein VNA69_19355 [Thermoanaerobaculia bacterium]|nr:hypothetical protein [Thermoanaerobaculia bacterium]
MRRLLQVFLILLSATAAFAQRTELPQLTWLRYYPEEVTRAAYEPFDRLLAEKKIIGWGVLTPMTRIDDSFSQIVYVSVRDWTEIDAVSLALDGSNMPRGRDIVIRHVIQAETPPAAKPRFLVVNEHPVTRGRDADAFALFNEWAKPVFLEVAAKGKLGPWGLSVQDVSIDNTWTYVAWYFMSDLSALDEVRGSLMNFGLSKLLTFERRLREMSEDDYRGRLYRVVYAAP